MRAESTNLCPREIGPPRGSLGEVWRGPLKPSALLVALYDDAPAVLAHPLVLDMAGHQRKKRVIATQPDPFSGLDLGAALADQDCARTDELAAVDLDPEHLRV